MLYNRIQGLVSVIIINYNQDQYIEDCLDSIKNQTYRNIEIIIIDDSSTDNSVEVINNWLEVNKRYLPKHNLVIWTSLPRNSGFEEAVSFGFFLAKGEFIACQDSNELSLPKRIEEQIDFLRENPELNVSDGGHCESLRQILFRGELFDKFEDLTIILSGIK